MTLADREHDLQIVKPAAADSVEYFLRSHRPSEDRPAWVVEASRGSAATPATITLGSRVRPEYCN